MRKVLLVGLVMGLAGCSSVDLARRHGLPAGYKMPVVLRDATGRRLCALYPDGCLELEGKPELAIRYLLQQRRDVEAAYQGRMQEAQKEVSRLRGQLEAQTEKLEAAERAQEKAERDLALARKELELRAAIEERRQLEAELARAGGKD